MKSTTLDVSVVICAYTEERWGNLTDAVQSLRQQTVLPREIILVIDHNASLFERAQLYFPDVLVIENNEARGLSGARNSGIARAQGELIAFLDDDATAEADWLIRLNRCCENTKALGAGGTVKPCWSHHPPAWFPREFYWVIGCSYQDVPEEPIKVRNPYGGCICIRREVFATVGGFKNEMGRIGICPMGCEETELCIRAQQHWPQRFFLYEPHAIVHHHIAAYRATWRYFRSRCYAEGLSKAAVTGYVGAKDGLASERTYTLQTLPRGVARGLTDGLLRHDPGGFLRAGAIIGGLLITTMGYIVGTVSRYVARHEKASIRADRRLSPHQAKKPELEV